MKKGINMLLLFIIMITIMIETVFADEAKFYGAGHIVAQNSTLGKVDIYVPYDVQGKIGTDKSGYMHSVSSNTVSGVMYTSNGTEYYWRCTSFSYPEYRVVNGTGYYTSGYFTPLENNISIATADSELSFNTVYPYIIVGLFGMVILCLMRFKH